MVVWEAQGSQWAAYTVLVCSTVVPYGLGSSDPTRRLIGRAHSDLGCTPGSGPAIWLALDSLTAPFPPGTMKSGEMTTS